MAMRVFLDSGLLTSKADLPSPADRDAADQAMLKFLKNPANPGLSVEKIAGARDPNMRSARVNQSIRLVFRQTGDEVYLLRVAAHDDAYRWAKRVRLRPHPLTGALQIVHTAEVYEQVVVEVAPEPLAEPSRFDAVGDQNLLELGVPAEALAAVRQVHAEDALLELAGLLPPDVGERLLQLWIGESVQAPTPPTPGQASIDVPDSRRQFCLVESDDEFQRVLEAPWAKWLAFLHPLQRSAAYGVFAGPLKVTGSAGTGKTVVAIHRARELARQGRRVLLTTYSRTLAANLQQNLRLLASPLELSRITVTNTHSLAAELLKKAGKRYKVRPPDEMLALFKRYRSQQGCTMSAEFLQAEWDRVLVPRGITAWPDYQAVSRQGRGIPLRAQDRKVVWLVMEAVLHHLGSHSETDFGLLCMRTRELLESGALKNPFTAVVVDEVQDLGAQEIQLLRALGGEGRDGLTVIGDAGQRIYPGGFSLRALGIETRGRSVLLRINYRTSRDIRAYADQILGDELDDLSGAFERRKGTISLFRGPTPTLHDCHTAGEQTARISELVTRLIQGGAEPGAIGIFAREKTTLEPIEKALANTGHQILRLKDSSDTSDLSMVRTGTMHRAKGLEFRFVLLATVNASVIPHPKAIEREDPVEAAEALERERQLLYVAITRAREEVHIFYFNKPSQFLKKAFVWAEPPAADAKGEVRS